MRCSSPPTLLCPLSASCLAPAVPRPNEVLSRRRPGPLSKPPPHYTYCWLYSQSVSGSVPASAMMESTIATPPTTPGMAYTVASMHVYTAHASPSQHMCVIRACKRAARPRASMQRACAHAHRSVPAAQDLSHPPPPRISIRKGGSKDFYSEANRVQAVGNSATQILGGVRSAGAQGNVPRAGTWPTTTASCFLLSAVGSSFFHGSLPAHSWQAPSSGRGLGGSHDFHPAKESRGGRVRGGAVLACTQAQAQAQCRWTDRRKDREVARGMDRGRWSEGEVGLDKEPDGESDGSS